MTKDLANIGLSEKSHSQLKEMTDLEMFNDLKDGYRLAISVAIKKKIDATSHKIENRKNMFDVGGVDQNFLLRNSIKLLYPSEEGQEYKFIEKLADLGVNIIYQNFQDNDETLELAELVSDET